MLDVILCSTNPAKLVFTLWTGDVIASTCYFFNNKSTLWAVSHAASIKTLEILFHGLVKLCLTVLSWMIFKPTLHTNFVFTILALTSVRIGFIKPSGKFFAKLFGKFLVFSTINSYVVICVNYLALQVFEFFFNFLVSQNFFSRFAYKDGRSKLSARTRISSFIFLFFQNCSLFWTYRAPSHVWICVKFLRKQEAFVFIKQICVVPENFLQLFLLIHIRTFR